MLLIRQHLKSKLLPIPAYRLLFTVKTSLFIEHFQSRLFGKSQNKQIGIPIMIEAKEEKIQENAITLKSDET